MKALAIPPPDHPKPRYWVYAPYLDTISESSLSGARKRYALVIYAMLCRIAAEERATTFYCSVCRLIGLVNHPSQKIPSRALADLESLGLISIDRSQPTQRVTMLGKVRLP